MEWQLCELFVVVPVHHLKRNFSGELRRFLGHCRWIKSGLWDENAEDANDVGHRLDLIGGHTQPPHRHARGGWANRCGDDGMLTITSTTSISHRRALFLPSSRFPT